MRKLSAHVDCHPMLSNSRLAHCFSAAVASTYMEKEICLHLGLLRLEKAAEKFAPFSLGAYILFLRWIVVWECLMKVIAINIIWLDVK